ncbi:fimbrial protein [Serratia fonticola]|uniref:fimbrial protein n=1 Tax=Serratia fonticola TaxID=47917 RepID=UPI0015C623E7|nr:fimbrial protein [Serratia fonticola]MBC3379048.1 fimbrial protein [Serratia fonticola]NYA38248.1 fimbrial protein [Serratia fonticola]
MNKSLQVNLSRIMGYLASCGLRRAVIGVTGSMVLCLASAQASNVLMVNITGTVIAGPACTITGNVNNRIEVEFGNDLLTTNIDGSNYTMPVPFSVVCNANTASLRLSFRSLSVSPFDSNLLATNFPDLGIKMLNPDGSAMNMNTWYQIPTPTSVTSPGFKAVPVKRPGSTLPGGGFGASATLEMEVL